MDSQTRIGSGSAEGPSDSCRNMFRLCRLLAADRSWNWGDDRIILEKPLLDILPLGRWDHARPPCYTCGFVVLGHYVAEVVEYSDSGCRGRFLEMELRSRLVCSCHGGASYWTTGLLPPGTGFFVSRVSDLGRK
jgi:hypothetical protein